MPHKISSAMTGLAILGIATSLTVRAAEAVPSQTPHGFRGALLATVEVTPQRIEQLRTGGYSAVAVVLTGDSAEVKQQVRLASKLVQQSSLELYYWVEVARSTEIADAHPEWMASLQGHSEWRRFFPDVPVPDDDEVIKNYPWVPILSQQTFGAQLQRVERLLRECPEPKGVFLNDLQGAPSACGCGHPLCRWTSDYGKKRTTTPLGDNAAALFVAEVQKLVPDAKVIPVWTTECEEHDGAKEGLCAGVGCFNGICWKSYTAQLMPLEQSCPQVAVLVPFRAFQRDLPMYGEKAGWIREALASFLTMPRRHGRAGIAASRLIAVLQGWDMDEADVLAQVKVANASGSAGYLIAFAKIEQGWQPRLVKYR